MSYDWYRCPLVLFTVYSDDFIAIGEWLHSELKSQMWSGNILEQMVPVTVSHTLRVQTIRQIPEY